MAAASNNDKTANDTIVTISMSGKDHAVVRALYEHLKAFPGYATDAAVLSEDTRREVGNLQFRYSAFVFHTT